MHAAGNAQFGRDLYRLLAQVAAVLFIAVTHQLTARFPAGTVLTTGQATHVLHVLMSWAGAIIQIGAYDLIACLAGDEQRIVSAFEQETGPVADPGTTQTDPQVRLTPKQRPVFEELIAGRSKKEISHGLRININTVGYHSKRIYKAFDVSSLGELLAAFIKRKSPKL